MQKQVANIAEEQDPKRSGTGHADLWQQDGVLVDPSRYVVRRDDRLLINLIVENLECPACVQRIEKGLTRLPGVVRARVNFSTHRLTVEWEGDDSTALDIAARLSGLGFVARPYDPAIESDTGNQDRDLLKCLGVAGFAAANVMLISVSVWAGLVSDMGPGTRGLFHWISALIALPAVAYAGRPFFYSAWSALRGGHLNMDVPISLAVLLACGMSIAETFANAEHVFFDAAVMLLFFLLIGRYLDRRARSQARSAAQNLLALRTTAATVIDVQGRLKMLPISEIEPGMKVMVSPGARIPVDGVLEVGASTIDSSMLTGESLPAEVKSGDRVFAGTINLSAAITVRVIKADEDTLLSEIVRLMEEAEQGRASYVRLADRAAQIYAPAVHGFALATFLGWWLLGGQPWQDSLFTAIAVLIITCPCALGLAVPVVQVVAVGRLLKRGLLVKAVEALEKLDNIDTVVFDKTGTLTTGQLTLKNADSIDPSVLREAAAIAVNSTHPLSRALVRAAEKTEARPNVLEQPGHGLAVRDENGETRLGSRSWCGATSAERFGEYSELWFSRPGREAVVFLFADELRDDSRKTVEAFRKDGLSVELLSGDHVGAVESLARVAGISVWTAEAQPQAKIARLQELKDQGHRVLMIGDGINDAPALATADVSLSPSSGSEVSLATADFVLQGRNLFAAYELYRVARKAKRLIFQNFSLAFVYNVIAIPLAIAGFVTPIVAALAMSASSLLVTMNAMRLLSSKNGERL